MLKIRATNSRSNFLKSSKAAAAVKSSHGDILPIVKNQNEVLRESIRILKDPQAAVHLKQKHLAQFIPYLKMHSEAEEQTIYATLKEIDDAQTATIEAYTEHSLAKSLVSELETKDYSRVWTNEIEARAKALAELFEHHADEEDLVREGKQVQPGRQPGHGLRGVSRTH